MYDNNAVLVDFETEPENNLTSKNATTDKNDVIAAEDNSSGLCFLSVFHPFLLVFFFLFLIIFSFILCGYSIALGKM